MPAIRLIFLRVGMALLTVALCLPLINIVTAWAMWDGLALAQWQHMAHTVLPGYALTSVELCIGVAIGVSGIGGLCAVLITLFDFPLKRTLQWALLLPLAIPAYVVAYTYADFFDYSGLAQTWLRDTFGGQGRVLPPIRSVGGAVLIFSLSLYPYVYLLTRTALLEQATHLAESAAMLGASRARIIARIALPLARPALAAGTALALMETLADYGVSSYLGIQTFTTGIYKAWLVMNESKAAAGLSGVLLLLMGVLLWLEHRAQSRLKLQAVRAHTHKPSQSAHQLRGALAWCATVLCALPVLLGAALPLAILTHAGWQTLGHTPLVASQLGHWVLNSVALGVITAILAVALAWGVTSWQRLSHEPLAKLAFKLGSLGYAVPGAVVVIGLLLPLAWVQQQWPQSDLTYVLTATWTGLIWAYLVRFMCIALQTTQSGLTRIPIALDDNARILGHSNASIARRVHWPLLQRPLAAAALLVMIDVIKELPVTLVLRPFDTDTLAVVAYQLARDERLGEAALPCLVLVLIGLIAVLVMNRQLERR